MFYVTNTSGSRFPYRVEAAEEGQQGQQRNKRHLKDKSEEKKQRKFLKACEMLCKQRPVIYAKEIMNKNILCLSANLSLDEVWEEVKKHHFEYFPVISPEGTCIGLLSEKEILAKVREKERGTLLKEIMPKKALCAEEQTILKDALQVFLNERIDAFPVLNKHHQVVGIVSRNDLVQTALKVGRFRP